MVHKRLVDSLPQLIATAKRASFNNIFAWLTVAVLSQTFSAYGNGG